MANDSFMDLCRSTEATINEMRAALDEQHRGPLHGGHVMILPEGWGSTFSGPPKPMNCHGCGAAPTKHESCPYCGRHNR